MRIGAQVAATTTPRELQTVVREVEGLGYEEIWLAEDYFDLGGIASVSAALAATQAVAVGLGVLANRVRHPAVTAMELATLAELYPGRFMAGLGHGVPGWMAQMGLRPASLVGSLREAVSSVRRLLDGETLTETGQYYEFDSVRLRHRPSGHVPLYLGVHGPRSLELSGELADGTLLGWFSSPEYVRWARERIDVGRARAGRTDEHALVSLCIVSVSDDDPSGARSELAAWATTSLAGLAGRPETEATADGRALGQALARLGADAEPLPFDVLSRFMAAGTSAEVTAFVRELFAAGADRVVLVPDPDGVRATSAMLGQLRAAARSLA
jgi:5,10-methylenetetrahydromethanopterin reductase